MRLTGSSQTMHIHGRFSSEATETSTASSSSGEAMGELNCTYMFPSLTDVLTFVGDFGESKSLQFPIRSPRKPKIMQLPESIAGKLSELFSGAHATNIIKVGITAISLVLALLAAVGSSSG